jgi:hypothetical protein
MKATTNHKQQLSSYEPWIIFLALLLPIGPAVLAFSLLAKATFIWIAAATLCVAALSLMAYEKYLDYPILFSIMIACSLALMPPAVMHFFWPSLFAAKMTYIATGVAFLLLCLPVYKLVEYVALLRAAAEAQKKAEQAKAAAEAQKAVKAKQAAAAKVAAEAQKAVKATQAAQNQRWRRLRLSIIKEIKQYAALKKFFTLPATQPDLPYDFGFMDDWIDALHQDHEAVWAKIQGMMKPLWLQQDDAAGQAQETPAANNFQRLDILSQCRLRSTSDSSQGSFYSWPGGTADEDGRSDGSICSEPAPTSLRKTGRPLARISTWLAAFRTSRKHRLTEEELAKIDRNCRQNNDLEPAFLRYVQIKLLASSAGTSKNLTAGAVSAAAPGAAKPEKRT